jgi:hypothetical protein
MINACYVQGNNSAIGKDKDKSAIILLVETTGDSGVAVGERNGFDGHDGDWGGTEVGVPDRITDGEGERESEDDIEWFARNTTRFGHGLFMT